jgi:hypothetical protein
MTEHRADWSHPRLVTGQGFPPPWTAEETDASFIVRDGKGRSPTGRVHLGFIFT